MFEKPFNSFLALICFECLSCIPCIAAEVIAKQGKKFEKCAIAQKMAFFANIRHNRAR